MLEVSKMFDATGKARRSFLCFASLSKALCTGCQWQPFEVRPSVLGTILTKWRPSGVPKRKQPLPCPDRLGKDFLEKTTVKTLFSRMTV